MATVEFDLSDCLPFFEKMASAAGGDFEKECKRWIEGVGDEMLRIIEDEIIRRQVVDTRLLLHSFERGGADNVWIISDGGMSIEVGTNVKYAAFVEDGHWTNSKGVARRFVPGYWSGDRFVYDPSADGGMMLKQHWVEGRHYFASAVRIIDKMMPELLEAKLQQWIDSYFDA